MPLRGGSHVQRSDFANGIQVVFDSMG
jgi:hypothetical protein